MLLRALVMTGFWPVMVRMSATADSSALGLSRASPTPMLTTILLTRGTCITLANWNSFINAGTTSSW